MATRQKTIEYWFPELASVTDNTDTNFTQITVYIPESSLTFRSVWLECTIQDAEITSNNVNRRQLSLQIGSSGYTAINNTNLLTSSGEQKWLHFSGDFTTLFTNSWSGTSMACDARVLCDSAIATPSQNWRCATARLVITYDYDDTATTQIKTVRIPLNAPIIALGTSKPASLDTIPNLSTYLPESSKTFRQYTIVVEGNEEGAATTDKTMSWEVDTGGVYTTGSHEQALNTASWYRHNQIQSFTTNATHSWYLWGSVADFDHPQVHLVVTYEYDESASTSIFNSLLLPIDFIGHGGGTTSSDYQRAEVVVYVEEPTTISIKQSALLLYYMVGGPVTNINVRCNGGSWSGNYSSVATTVAGSCGLMFRCEGDISLARGKNTITFDSYHATATNSTDGSGFNGFLILNYTSGKASAGSGVHNKSIFHKIYDSTLTSAVHTRILVSATSIAIPETNYYINNVAGFAYSTQNTTIVNAGFIAQAERLSGEGGIKWEHIINVGGYSDGLTGKRYFIGSGTDTFKKYPTDISGIDIETSRRFRLSALSISAGHWCAFGLWITYHSITYTVSGSVTASAGGTVTLTLIRNSDKKALAQTSRTGNGSYSFTWYDNTENVFVEAVEDSTHVGRSENNVAT